MSRKSHLLRTYGITEEQYDELLAQQSNACWVCRRDASVFKTRLCVDHNHKTGEVRGLLCTHCNLYLVGKHTDPNLLRRIADYLEQGTGWFVPPRKPKRRRKKSNPKTYSVRIDVH